MRIKYFLNRLSFDDLTQQDLDRIDNIVFRVREDICDWTDAFRFVKLYKNKTVTNLFIWNEMSTWWLNRLANKDSYTSTNWINRLIVLYIIKEFSHTRDLHLYTDDQILRKSISKNKKNLVVNVFFKTKPFQKAQDFYFRFLNIGVVIGAFFKHCLVNISLQKFKGKVNFNHENSSIVWFKTSYPINWKAGNSSIDRLYDQSPFMDKKYNFESVYLVFTTLSNFRVFRYNRAVKNLHFNSKRKVAFPEAELSLKDILTAYVSTLCEQIKFTFLSMTQRFQSAFVLNGLEVSDILIAEWSKSYWGFQQFSKLQGVAHSKFFEKMTGHQTIVTYGEFFPQNRACYFLTKKNKYDITFVAIQHAMNAKNKMFTYYRSDEFKYDDDNHGINYSPYPDYFLVQGRQYYEILSKFFPSKKIHIIGSLKSFEKPKLTKSGIFNDHSLNGKKLLLLAPSVGDDYQLILSFFKDWVPLPDWQIVLCPHPIANIEEIKSYKEREIPDISIDILEKGIVYDVLSKSDLVVAANSTIAIEARVFGVNSIRLRVPWLMSQFDHDERIESFSNRLLFQEWLKHFDPSKKNINDANIISDYFYKNDNSTPKRLWDFLKVLKQKKFNI